MTFTESDLTNLKKALLTGALEVQIGDRRVKYRTQAEIIALIEAIETSINGVPDDSPNIVKATFSKGSE